MSWVWHRTCHSTLISCVLFFSSFIPSLSFIIVRQETPHSEELDTRYVLRSCNSLEPTKFFVKLSTGTLLERYSGVYLLFQETISFIVIHFFRMLILFWFPSRKPRTVDVFRLLDIFQPTSFVYPLSAKLDITYIGPITHSQYMFRISVL